MHTLPKAVAEDADTEEGASGPVSGDDAALDAAGHDLDAQVFALNVDAGIVLCKYQMPVGPR